MLDLKMMRPMRNALWATLLGVLGFTCLAIHMSQGHPTITSRPLPPIPDALGFAGMYAGVTEKGIVAAGGHRFSDGIPWWHGGEKVWSDVIFTFDRSAGSWQVRDVALPRPLGDGVGAGFRDGVVCAGGGDASRAYDDVFYLQWESDRIETRTLPPLPSPRLKMGGAMVGDVLYLVGGLPDPRATTALHELVALDLSKPEGERRWISLPAWPGPARMMPVVAASRDALYIFGGIQVVEDANGRPKILAPYLSDAYRYHPGSGGTSGRWERLADLPRAVAAAPSPAWLPDDDTILIFGGVDGAIEAINDRSSVDELPDGILAYTVSTDQWSVAGRMSSFMIPRVNTPAVPWNGGYVMITGEDLPTRRTNACTVVELAPSPLQRPNRPARPHAPLPEEP